MSIFLYTNKIKTELPKAVKDAIGLKAKSVKKLEGGEVNYSFRVDTNERTVLARVSRYESWPDERSLRFVETKLKEINIEHSKTIYFDSSDRYFPNGFMIAEWIEGVQGNKAIEQGLVTKNEMFESIARILSKIHTIKFNSFGGYPFDKDDIGHKVFSKYIFNSINRDRLDRMTKESLVSESLVSSGELTVKNLGRSINFRVEPVMVHGDASPDNVIWTNGRPILVDWEDVKANSWIYDVAWLSYFYGKNIHKPFLRGYAGGNIDMDRFDLVERIFHINLSLNLLPYYAYDSQNMSNVKNTIKKLDELVSVKR